MELEPSELKQWKDILEDMMKDQADSKRAYGAAESVTKAKDLADHLLNDLWGETIMPSMSVGAPVSGGALGSGRPSAQSVKAPTQGEASEAATQNETAEAAAEVKASEDPQETLEDVMAELNDLVGLDNIKKDVKSLMNFINICKLREENGLKVPKVSYHLVFTGNPGTGKTTIARLVARLYKLMGILPEGQLIETDRSGLVGQYMGQTAVKTQEVIQQAMGGVLFIDEAYALANDEQDFYGKEAIETILKAMEDNRDKLVVIVAGYDELMHKFIESNPGLKSRFNKYFHFEDYSGEDLLKILERFCKSNGYILEEGLADNLKAQLDDVVAHKDQHFGNARYVRNLFELAIHCQADRLASDTDITADELQTLTQADMTAAIEGM